MDSLCNNPIHRVACRISMWHYGYRSFSKDSWQNSIFILIPVGYESEDLLCAVCLRHVFFSHFGCFPSKIVTVLFCEGLIIFWFIDDFTCTWICSSEAAAAVESLTHFPTSHSHISLLNRNNDSLLCREVPVCLSCCPPSELLLSFPSLDSFVFFQPAAALLSHLDSPSQPSFGPSDQPSRSRCPAHTHRLQRSGSCSGQLAGLCPSAPR